MRRLLMALPRWSACAAYRCTRPTCRTFRCAAVSPRGSVRPAPIWQGFYIGGQAGQTWMDSKPASNYNNDITAAIPVAQPV